MHSVPCEPSKVCIELLLSDAISIKNTQPATAEKPFPDFLEILVPFAQFAGLRVLHTLVTAGLVGDISSIIQ